jgi:hypothetical protein
MNQPRESGSQKKRRDQRGSSSGETGRVTGNPDRSNPSRPHPADDTNPANESQVWNDIDDEDEGMENELPGMRHRSNDKQKR